MLLLGASWTNAVDAAAATLLVAAEKVHFMALTSSIPRRCQGCRGLLWDLPRKSIIEAKTSTVTCLAICTGTGNATVQLSQLPLHAVEMLLAA